MTILSLDVVRCRCGRSSAFSGEEELARTLEYGMIAFTLNMTRRSTRTSTVTSTWKIKQQCDGYQSSLPLIHSFYTTTPHPPHQPFSSIHLPHPISLVLSVSLSTHPPTPLSLIPSKNTRQAPNASLCIYIKQKQLNNGQFQKSSSCTAMELSVCVCV